MSVEQAYELGRADERMQQLASANLLVDARNAMAERLKSMIPVLVSAHTLLAQCADVFELEGGPEREAVKKCRHVVAEIDALIGR
jgi:hypothetical protein